MKRALAAAAACLAAAAAALTPTSAYADVTTEVRVDAHVQQSSPSTNYETSTTLYANNSSAARRYTFVKVHHAAVPTGQSVVATYLRVFVTGTVPSGATLSADLVSNTWTEASATYNRQPALISTAPGSVSAAPGWVAIPITATPGATQSYRIRTDAVSSVSFSSQENTDGNGPEVLLDTDGPATSPPPSSDTPVCPATTLTRTGAQTTGISQTNNGGTWDLTDATWTNSSLGVAVRSDAVTSGCVIGGNVDGSIPDTATRECWFDRVGTGCTAQVGDGFSNRLTNTSRNSAVQRGGTVSDYEDAYDLQTDYTATTGGSAAYLDHVKADYIRDDCVENEGSSSSPDVPVQHLTITGSFFDRCFTGLAWRPPESSSAAEGTRADASFDMSDSLLRVSPQPLGSTYCPSGSLTSGRCQSAPTSVSDSGMVGAHGIWKWSTFAPTAANVHISDTVFRVDAQSYSSCRPWDFPNGTYENVTVVWAGAGGYYDLCPASTYALPAGVRLTTDLSVWSTAVANYNATGTPFPTSP
jgi:hypothetical protein